MIVDVRKIVDIRHEHLSLKVFNLIHTEGLRLYLGLITARNSSCGKVMFSQASVILPRGAPRGKGGVHGEGGAWQKGHVYASGGGMHGKSRFCVVKGEGACMVKRGVHGKGGMHSRIETATSADGTHPTGMQSC